MPAQLGRYELLEQIGKGGMGAVHRARDPVIGRIVAIKTILVSENRAARERFVREARALGNLSHANIVAVYDFSVEDNVPYIVMEFVDGESLHSRLARGRLPIAGALAILSEAAEALDFAHAEGIIHRDVKPENVMLGRGGRTKLADFGIARISDEDTITATGVVPGTVSYMAPELLKGSKPVPASDQFSLAVMAYFMLTGRKPFVGENPNAVMYQIATAEPLSPSLVDPSLPKAIDGAVLRGLKKDPSARYPDCKSLVEALQRVFREAEDVATTPSPVKAVPEMVACEIRTNPRDLSQYVWIPPGSMQLGCPPADQERFPEEIPRHMVTMQQGFWLGETPVTVAAWKRFAKAAGKPMPSAPGFNKSWAIERQPMVNVSWHDAQAYCKWAGGRLPTEDEWEYAARAHVEEALYGPIDEICWYESNSGDAAREVGLKASNAFGLFDVLGNVWEWTADVGAPPSAQHRAARGGSWYNGRRHSRLSGRFEFLPEVKSRNIGFRCLWQPVQ